MKNQTPQYYTVEVEHNGKRHQAQYTVINGVVEVFYGMAKNSASSLNQHPETIASQLLREILEGRYWKP